jgi:quercetin dioxygenase-like cupin family protein
MATLAVPGGQVTVIYKVLIAVCVLNSMAAAQQSESPYPVPGRVLGTTAFSREDSAETRSSEHYPAWLRGNAPGGKADGSAKYFYTQLLGPKKTGDQDAGAGFNADKLRMGTLELRPGATYPAHNHPTREVYFVVQGEADWYVDDEKQHVTAGSIIMHRPYAVHGWTNTSKSKPLKVVWIRWAEAEDPAESLDSSARFINPDTVRDEKTAKPFAVPLPAPHP